MGNGRDERCPEPLLKGGHGIDPANGREEPTDVRVNGAGSSRWNRICQKRLVRWCSTCAATTSCLVASTRIRTSFPRNGAPHSH
jgi:hypothetical protein